MTSLINFDQFPNSKSCHAFSVSLGRVNSCSCVGFSVVTNFVTRVQVKGTGVSEVKFFLTCKFHIEKNCIIFEKLSLWWSKRHQYFIKYDLFILDEFIVFLRRKEGKPSKTMKALAAIQFE